MRPDTSQLSWAESFKAAVAVAVGTALLLWPVLFGGRSTQSFPLDDPRIDIRPWARPGAETGPINPITPDIDLFVLPGVARTAQLVEQGVDPWWDSSQLLGYPLAANQPFPLFSPVAWVTRVLGPISGLDWLLWLHTAIAAWLAYRTARLLGTGPPAAAVAAVGFALSTWMFTRWHLPQIAHTTSWWPGLVGALEWFRRGRSDRGVFEGGLCGGLALLSGFPQVALLLLAGFVALAALDRRLWRTGPLLGVGGVLLLSMALAVGPTILSVNAYRHSLRSSPEATEGTGKLGLEPGALAAVLLPEYFGRPSDFAEADPPAPTMESYIPRRALLSDDLQDNPVENALHPGALVLVLLTVLLGRGVGGRARVLVGFALLMLVVALAWPAVVRLAPGATRLGAGHIKRLLVLVAGCLPLAAALCMQAVVARRARVPWLGTGVLVAAAWGLVAWSWSWTPATDQGAVFVTSLQQQALRMTVLLGACAVALALARQRRGLFLWLPALLLALDLGVQARRFNPFPPQGEAFPSTPALEWLASRPGRVAGLGRGNVLPPSAAGLHGIRSVHGVAPMIPTRSAELLGVIEGPLFEARDPRVLRPFQDPASMDHPVLDLLGVRSVVHGDPAYVPLLSVPVAYSDEAEGLAVHDRPGAGPRAFLTGGMRVVPASEMRLELLGRRDFDPFATVLLEREPGLSLPESGPMQPVEVQPLSPLRFAADVQAAGPGILVFNEAWDPGWHIQVDGVERPVLIAHHALLGVALEGGSHRVTWTYQPASVGPDRLATAAALLALAALAWRSRRQAGPSSPDRKDRASSTSASASTSR